MTTATFLVDALNLPRPIDDRRILWSTQNYESSFAHTDEVLRRTQLTAFGIMNPVFSEIPVDFGKINPEIQRAAKGRLWWRPHFYLSLALALEFKDQPARAIEKFSMERMKPEIRAMLELLCVELAKLPGVKASGTAWFTSMGFRTMDDSCSIGLKRTTGSGQCTDWGCRDNGDFRQAILKTSQEADTAGAATGGIEAFRAAARRNGLSARFDATAAEEGNIVAAATESAEKGVVQTLDGSTTTQPGSTAADLDVIALSKPLHDSAVAISEPQSLASSCYTEYDGC